MYNSLALIGNLVAKPEKHATKDGKAFISGRLAVNEGTKEDPKAFFIGFKSFGKTAETIFNHCDKGSRVLLAGRLTEETWTTKDGKPGKALAMVVDNMSFFESKKPAESKPKVTDGEKAYAEASRPLPKVASTACEVDVNKLPF